MKILLLYTIGILATALGGCAMAPPPVPERAALHEVGLRNPEPIRRSNGSPDGQTTSSLTLDQATELGLANNPRLQADYRRVEVLLLEVPQVSSLEDPMAEVGQREAFRGPANDRENMVGISQTFPWFGKRRLRGLVAGSEADEALAEYRMAVLDYRRDVHAAWWRLEYSRQNAALLGEERRLIEEARNATLALYQSGRLDRSALLRVETEAAMIAGLLDENEGQGKAALHDLERLLATSLDGTTLVGDTNQSSIATAPGMEELIWVALEHRPELAVYAASEKRAALQERLARADYYPDFTLGGGWTGMGMRADSYYDFDSGNRTDSWQASAGINIPIPNARRKAAVAQARKRAEEARLRQDATADQILQEIGGTRSMIDSLERQARLYATSTIPLAGESFESTRAAYQSGTATYADLIDVQRTLVGARREHLRLRRDLALAVVELERALGAPLTVVTAKEAVAP